MSMSAAINNLKNAQSIEKEQIEGLKFPATEVLTDESQIAERNDNLKRALTLGNIERGKARIYFEDDQCLRVVETTVWGVTDKRIILKHGVVIPIQRVHKIST
jgi:hypothetical protein